MTLWGKTRKKIKNRLISTLVFSRLSRLHPPQLLQSQRLKFPKLHQEVCILWTFLKPPQLKINLNPRIMPPKLPNKKKRRKVSLMKSWLSSDVRQSLWKPPTFKRLLFKILAQFKSQLTIFRRWRRIQATISSFNFSPKRSNMKLRSKSWLPESKSNRSNVKTWQS